MEPTDYAGNSKNQKDTEKKEAKPEKEIRKVVSSPVTVQKKSLGKRFKGIIAELEFRTVFDMVLHEYVIPGVKNTLLNSISNGAEKMLFPGESRRPTGAGTGVSRFSYSGLSRNMGGSPLRNAPSIPRGPRPTRQSREEFVIPSRVEAEEILDLMREVIDQWQVVSVAEFCEMVDQPLTPVDQKWGWSNLADARILEVRGGYLIDLPPAEPIQ
jgi:hypothetical protein